MEDDFQSVPKTDIPKTMTTPVMDIKPHTNPAPDNRPHTPPAYQADPADGHDTKQQPDANHAQPAPAKQPSNGTSAAITATVIIVIALAALATYAYLKTAK